MARGEDGIESVTQEQALPSPHAHIVMVTHETSARMRRGSRSHKLLRYLALGSGVLVISVFAPAAGARVVQAAIEGYFRRKRFERQRFLRDLKRLQMRNLIDFRERGGGEVEITLTKHGKDTILLHHNLDTIQLSRPRRWDGTWRLILFDIPHTHKRARDTFRRKLLDLRFHPLQKSAFLTPFPCEDEIEFLAAVFDVRRYVLILHVGHFEGEEKLRHHFNL